MRQAITLVLGIMFGSAIIGGAGSAVSTRSVFVVTEIDQITDNAGYDALKKAMAPRAVVEAQLADGRYLARTESVAALDGNPPKAIIILSFDSDAKAKTYYEGVKEITAERMKATKSRSFIVAICSERGALSSGC
jgi:uncharacterized protein (DUF1330 family)